MHQISAEERYRDGETIFDEGSHGDWVYIVNSGAVELYRTVDGETHLLETLGPGEIFGEISFIAHIPRYATAKAKGDTLLEIFDRNFLDDEFNKLSESFRMILQRLAHRFKQTVDQSIQSHARRQSPRFGKVLSLTFKSGASLVNAFSENINADGMFIKTTKALDKGDRFFLKLQLPDGTEPIKIGCEVAWNRTAQDGFDPESCGMGIRFIQISAADKQRLVGGLKNAGAGK